mmetsp:Transcript_27063/g.63514  ORF Transcript_27063/g.63514 Transcript_27063/m.63514 type:complete len:343 (-) Transcript_27063:3-1031(-)
MFLKTHISSCGLVRLGGLHLVGSSQEDLAPRDGRSEAAGQDQDDKNVLKQSHRHGPTPGKPGCYDGVLCGYRQVQQQPCCKESHSQANVLLLCRERWVCEVRDLHVLPESLDAGSLHKAEAPGPQSLVGPEPLQVTPVEQGRPADEGQPHDSDSGGRDPLRMSLKGDDHWEKVTKQVELHKHHLVEEVDGVTMQHLAHDLLALLAEVVDIRSDPLGPSKLHTVRQSHPHLHHHVRIQDVVWTTHYTIPEGRDGRCCKLEVREFHDQNSHRPLPREEHVNSEHVWHEEQGQQCRTKNVERVSKAYHRDSRHQNPPHVELQLSRPRATSHDGAQRPITATGLAP